jgi:hypothetical protein
MAFSDGKQSRLLVPFLLLVIAVLVVLNFYQNNVIQNQSVEIHWLMSQKTVGGAVPVAPATAQPAADPAARGQSAKPGKKSSGDSTAEPRPKSN